MKCPKCDNNKYFGVADAIKRLRAITDIGDDMIDVEDTLEYESRIIYIRCNECGYRSFGADAEKVFDIDLEKGEKFDYSVTQEEVRDKLKELAEDEYGKVSFRERLETNSR
jgi:predicted nucleic-acid-binding Zn-ribbon protein